MENNTPVKTVKEWLFEMFGATAAAIREIDNPWVSDTLSARPRLLIRESNGGLYVICGGEAIMQFSRTDNIRGSVMLVRDSMARDAWEAEQDRARANNQHTPTRPAPDAVLRLAYTA